jgi:hypothetical protein
MIPSSPSTSRPAGSGSAPAANKDKETDKETDVSTPGLIGGRHELGPLLGQGGSGREISLQAGLAHASLIPLLGAGLDEGRRYLVMPLVQGMTLADRIAFEPLAGRELQAVGTGPRSPLGPPDPDPQHHFHRAACPQRRAVPGVLTVRNLIRPEPRFPRHGAQAQLHTTTAHRRENGPSQRLAPAHRET